MSAAKGRRAAHDDSQEGEPEGFAAAVAELESILDELESSDVDVDVLTSRLRRAATLIDFCRERISGASVDVERIVAGLAGEPGEDPQPGTG